MFEKMAASGLNTTQPLKWGYFFLDTSRRALAHFADTLGRTGYHREELRRADRATWLLQLSRTEVHTPDSLHERNLKLNAIAHANGVQLYDGWDVTAPRR